MTDRVTQAPAPLRAPWRVEHSSRTDRRLLSRSFMTVVSRGVSKFTLLGFMIVAGRLLSLEEFASYSYLVALATILTLLSETGVPLVGSRDVAAARATTREVYWSSLPVVAGVALVASAVLVGIGSAATGPGAGLPALLLTGGFVFCNRLFDFAGNLLRGIGRYGFEAGLEVTSAAFFVAGAVAAALLGLGVTGVIAMFFLKELLAAIAAHAALRADVGTPMRAQPELWRRLLSTGIHLGLATAAMMVVTRVAFFILGNTASHDEVAWYSGALRFADTAFLFATTAGVSLLPGVAYLATHHPERVRRLFLRVTLGIVAVTAVAAAVTVPLAATVMRTVFGPNFAPAGPSAAVLLAGLPLYALFGICWYALLALDREHALLRLAAVGAVLSVGVGVALVPSGGAVGAAWSYVIAVGFMAGGSLLLLHRRLADGL
jgi:O-antigen/teichoic acid export membrane protein